MHNPHDLVQERLTRKSWGMLGTQGYVLGVDVAGYTIQAGLIDLHSRTYANISAEPSSSDPQQTVDETIALCRRLLEQYDVTLDRLVRVGVGFGGPVDAQNGTVLLSPRMPGWERFPLKEQFEGAFDAVTLVDNDANLIALGEATFGVGRDVDNLFYLHLSSGVGGGIVLNGKLYHGTNSTAGEIGHARVGLRQADSDSAATLEDLVSVSGLLRRAGELGLHTDNLEDVFSTNATGQRVVHETTALLSLQLAQLATLLDPEMIVLGGIVARIGGEPFAQAIGTQLQDSIAPQFAHPVQVVSSVLGYESIAIGALACALESLQE